MTKLLINLQAGLIEIEGDEVLAQRVYADFKDLLLTRAPYMRLGGSAEVETPVPAESDGGDASAGNKKPRRRSKGGPSCASRIKALQEEDFFQELRSAGEVGTKLRERGTAYEGKHVAAALIDLVRRGTLRRVSQGGSWSYQNP